MPRKHNFWPLLLFVRPHSVSLPLSQVRSACEYLEMDAKHRLGFVANPKRFNVALTRSKVRVIIDVASTPHVS